MNKKNRVAVWFSENRNLLSILIEYTALWNLIWAFFNIQSMSGRWLPVSPLFWLNIVNSLLAFKLKGKDWKASLALLMTSIIGFDISLSILQAEVDIRWVHPFPSHAIHSFWWFTPTYIMLQAAWLLKEAD